MRSFEELLKESSTIHGHHCAGQVLGVRMAMIGCREVGIDEPKNCKKLIIYVEMDRCATDAVQAVTGCSLGKRTLKFLDYGKMAATFINTETQQAVRILAKDDARAQVPRYAGSTDNWREAQKQAYRVMPEALLFSIRSVVTQVPPRDMPGYRGERVYCTNCGEGINFDREVRIGGQTLCVPCAQSLNFIGNGAGNHTSVPKILLIVGYKKVGKTTLIEKIIPELSRRGYRVGTVKHHHSDIPVSFDTAGTDSSRHRQAGAIAAALASPTEIAFFRNGETSISLDQIVSALGPMDIVLVEGFHQEARNKIEVLGATNEPLCKNDRRLLAVVTPSPHSIAVPAFAPSSIKALVDLIERQVLKAE
jgi:formylmethanofuran dehydrogenase subunit E